MKIWIGGILGAIIIGVGGYMYGVSSGALPRISIALEGSDTPTPTVTLTPTNLPTATETPSPTLTLTETETPTPSDTPSNTPTETLTPTDTPSNTPTETPSQTASPTPSETATDAATPSTTPNMTETLAVQRTATYEACSFDYAIIEQDPLDGEDGDFHPINTAYTRNITLLNAGSCAWERNTSLAFVNGSGESFDAGPRIFIREPVDVGEEVVVMFEGRLPSRGSQTPYTGMWQLRTPGQIAIGEPFAISVLVYDPGN